jgi:1,4-dihydroxy-2-naphthoyl-CoA synthase
MLALKLHYDSDESKEGALALQQKRDPDFRKFL